MEYEMLQKMKKDYNDRIEEYRKKEKMLKRLNELAKIAQVQEYISLSEKVNSLSKGCPRNFDKRLELLYIKKRYEEEIKNPINIYVYFGVVESNFYTRDKKIFSYLYTNLENSYITKRIMIEEREKFEEDNIVLFPKEDEVVVMFYNTMSKIYLETCITDSREAAIEKMIFYSKNGEK